MINKSCQRLVRIRLTGLSASAALLPVRVLQQSSIFAPADFGRRGSLRRAPDGQRPCGVGEERAVSDADVDVLLKGGWDALLLSDDRWSLCYRLQWRVLGPVGQSVCGRTRKQKEKRLS